MYTCKYFKIKELVHPDLLKTMKESVLWMIFDDRVLKCADLIRELYGPCTINASGLTSCGLRPQNCSTGAIYSAHKVGRALDLHIRSIELKYSGNAKAAEYNKVRQNLLKDDRFSCLNFEDNIRWLHIDTYNRPNRLFNP